MFALNSCTRIVLCAAFAFAGAIARAQDLERVETAHYKLQVAGSKELTAELSKMLELAWPRFAEYLRCEPKLAGGERFQVRVLRTQEDYDNAILADKLTRPTYAQAVWSSITNKTLYLRQAPTPYLTRFVLLYGACLQFHALAKTKNRDLDRTWYMSGIANGLAVHRWDGQKLELGVRPIVCDVDYPKGALAMLGEGPLPAEALSEDRLLEAPLACGLMRFLSEANQGKYKKRFEKLALGTTGSKVSGLDFLSSLGNLDKIAIELRSYLKDEELPFEVHNGGWEETQPRTIVANAHPTAQIYAHLRGAYDVFELNLRIPIDATSAVILGWVGPDEFTIARYAPPHFVIEGFKQKQRTFEQKFPIPDANLDVVPMSFKRAEGKLSIQILGIPPFEIDAPAGTYGLMAEDGRAVFENVQWR